MRRWSFIHIALFLFVSSARSQSVPSLRPPDQTYIYNFNAAVAAVAPVIPALNLGPSYSIEFWTRINRDAVYSQYIRLFHKGITATGDPFTGYQLELDPSTRQLSYAQSTGVPGSYRSARIGVSLAPGQWYHVAIVSDNLQVRLYLNGQQQASFTVAGAPPVNSWPLVLAGQAYGDGTGLCCGFPGSLRQFRIWGRALQAMELTTYATKILSGTEAGLIADWPLDDGQGTLARDLGPNHAVLKLTSSSNPSFVPVWMRTAVVDQEPVFQVQKLTLPVGFLQSPMMIPLDFDSDGDVDLLVCQASFDLTPQPCVAFRNDGEGRFSDATSQVLGSTPPTFNLPRDFAIADFNGDGLQDVAIANNVDCGVCSVTGVFGGAQVRLLLQTADGRLDDVTATHLPARLAFTHNVAAADIDGDGDVDLYLANLISVGTGPPEIYLNDGQGRFTVGEPERLPAILRTGSRPFVSPSARFIDVNNDGRPDLFVGSDDKYNRPRDHLLINDGRGYFTLAPDNSLPPRYGGRNWGTVSIHVTDLDGDGWQDLVNTVNAVNYSEGAVQILLNSGDGTFRDATDLIVQPPWERHGSLFSDGVVYVDPVYVADFNGDGFVDLLAHGVNQPSRLFLNTGPARGSRFVEVSELLPAAAGNFAVADFNGDNKSDVAGWLIPCCEPMVLETWLNTGKFTLTPELIPPIPTGPFFLRGSVLNSATLSADALAPGEIVTIFGRDFGPSTPETAAPSGGKYPTELAGGRVLFNGVAAPLIYAAPGQISTVVPFNAVPKSRSDVVVEYQGVRSLPVSIYVADSAPGLFTVDNSGAGPASVLNIDPVTGAVSVNSPQNPAPRGGYIVVYITGGGQTDPPSTDGILARPLGRLALPVEAGLDFFSAMSGFNTTRCDAFQYCLPVEVLSAGPAAGMISGITQVIMRVPDTPVGAHSLGISIGGIWSQHFTTVSIR